MRWNKESFKTSIYSIFGFDTAKNDEASTTSVTTQTMAVRTAMLRTLGDDGRMVHPRIYRKIRFAKDIHGLWYCRSELMAVLANVHGEATARETIASLSDKFEGLLPNSLQPRTPNSPRALNMPSTPKRIR